MTCELNIEDFDALEPYLCRRGLLTADEHPVMRKLEGGVSNRVVLVQPRNGPGFVLKQALEKLRVAVDWFCTPTRIEREALALRHLSGLAPPGSVPGLLFEDPPHHLLAMEAVPKPHDNWKQMLLSGRLIPDHVQQFGRILGCIHTRSSHADAQLLDLFADRDIYEALRLEPYYRYTATQVPQSAPFLNELIDDTLARRDCLVHGDFSPKNILVHDDRLVLLDCEVVHLGDPAFDIGFSFAHFLGKAHHVPDRRADFKQAALQYWQTYVDCSTTPGWISDMQSRAVRHTLACCLARVAGRSPLEYLTPAERTAQATLTVSLMQTPPPTMPDLVREFTDRLPCPSSNN